MRRSAAYSAILHLAVLLFATFGLPQLMQPPIVLDQPLVVEILPIAEKTNVPPPAPTPPRPEPPKPEPPKPEPPKPEPPKPEPPKPEPPKPEPPKPEPPKPEPPKPEPPPPPTPPPPPPEPPPPPPRPEPPPPPKPEPPKPEPAPKLEPKPEPKAEVQEPPPPPPRPRPPVAEAPKKPREQAFDLDAVLKDLTKRQPQAKSPPPAPAAAPAPQQQAMARSSSNAPSNPTQPLTMSEQDAIRQHVERFWNPPVGARDAQDLVVEVRVWVDPDGTVRDVRTVDQGRAARDEFFRAAAESAERAVRRASPLPVPRDKHEQFKVMILGFSPREMLGIRG